MHADALHGPARDLHARHKPQARLDGGGSCRFPTGGGVMVGQRHDVKAGGCRGPHHLGGRFGAVGNGGMRVQVDLHRTNLRQEPCRVPMLAAPWAGETMER